MKEQELIELGFEKITDVDEIDNVEFYYYGLKIGKASQIELHTQCNTDIINNEWNVRMDETWILVKDKENLKELIDVLSKQKESLTYY